MSWGRLLVLAACAAGCSPSGAGPSDASLADSGARDTGGVAHDASRDAPDSGGGSCMEIDCFDGWTQCLGGVARGYGGGGWECCPGDVDCPLSCPVGREIQCTAGCAVDPCWWYAGLTDLAQLCAETPPAAVGQPCSSDAECLPFATLTAVDGTVVRQLLVCDTGTQTCAAATTVPPRIDLYECRVLVAGFPCTPGAVLGCIGSSLARCAPSGATVALETCPYGCEPDRGACDECPIDTRYCDGNTLIECDGSGQLSTKTCPYGCDASSTSLCY